MDRLVLITGAGGFIGRACVRHFEEKGWNTYQIGNSIKPGVRSINGEVTSKNISKFNKKFDVIIHLAGVSRVSDAVNYKEESRNKTVNSTKEVISYLNESKSKSLLIYISSAAIYGDNGLCKLEESLTPTPFSEYGRLKAECESILIQNCRENKYKLAIVRLFSAYGNGLKKQVIWDFCTKIQENLDKTELHCFGTGNEERDFIHIEDILLLFDKIIELNKPLLIVNGGTGVPTKIRTLFESISQKMGYKGNLVFTGLTKSEDPQSLVADTTKMSSIGFECQVPVEKGILNYINWFRNEKKNEI